MICVVEQPVDVVSLERTPSSAASTTCSAARSRRSTASSPSDLRIDELLQRVDANGVQEVVLATNPNMTGEATAAFLADRLRGRVRVTRLASGLPVGGDLEYADEVTLGRALVRPPRDVSAAPTTRAGSARSGRRSRSRARRAGSSANDREEERRRAARRRGSRG